MTGAVRVDEVVCQEAADSCEGTYFFPAAYGSRLECDGYGPEDGEIFAITEAINAAWALHMECWVEGYRMNKPPFS